MTEGAVPIVLAASLAVLFLVLLLYRAGREQGGQVSRERRLREARERRRRRWAGRDREDT